MRKGTLWLVVILLVAAALRLASLAEVPPGVTHDEADHGLAAWEVVNGARPLYFTVGYGREPLYDYATAGMMAAIGRNFLAGRLTAVFFSLILIAATYGWARRAFDRRVALLTAAGLAVSFWAVMTGRQALRSITLPALLALAAMFYWHGLLLLRRGRQPGAAWLPLPILASFALTGIMLGLSFYTYIPARALWLIFPAAVPLLLVADRRQNGHAWRGLVVTLVIALLVALPLLLFLARNPGIEVRLDELSAPLQAAAQGDARPLLDNVWRGLGVLFLRGDDQWRYNTPGRPLLPPVMAVLLVAGLAMALWRVMRARGGPPGDGWRGAAALFALLWLLLGLAPTLLTGPSLSTTRAIGMQPVLFLFPALALAGLAGRLRWSRRTVAAAAGLLFAFVGVGTARAYFGAWAVHPEVRVQYESALVAAVRFLNDGEPGAVGISTTTPGRYHSPAVAALYLHNPGVTPRWFDGRHSLLIPADGPARLIFSGFAPLNPLLQPFFAAGPPAEIALPETDLDRPLTVYAVGGQALLATWETQLVTAGVAPDQPPLDVGGAADFLGYRLLTTAARAGDEVALVTAWRVRLPLDDAVLFSHVLDAAGRPLAQDDRLDVPSESWRPGDVFLQLHRFSLPDDLSAGEYPLAVGLYTRRDLERLPVLIGGREVADQISLPPLRVGP